jgi:hypothetical protein
VTSLPTSLNMASLRQAMLCPSTFCLNPRRESTVDFFVLKLKGLEMLLEVTMRPVNDAVECASTLLFAEVSPPQL